MVIGICLHFISSLFFSKWKKGGFRSRKEDGFFLKSCSIISHKWSLFLGEEALDFFVCCGKIPPAILTWFDAICHNNRWSFIFARRHKFRHIFLSPFFVVSTLRSSHDSWVEEDLVISRDIHKSVENVWHIGLKHLGSVWYYVYTRWSLREKNQG